MQLIHESVSQSDKIIGLLDDKSKQIGAILEVIQHIAEQTNLLALNAAIDTARAWRARKRICNCKEMKCES